MMSIFVSMYVLLDFEGGGGGGGSVAKLLFYVQVVRHPIKSHRH